MNSHACRLLVLPTLLLVGSVASAATDASTATTELSTVHVVGDKEPAEGSAEGGYRYATASLGPLGDRRTADIPMSLNAVSSELLRNYGAQTYSEAVKYIPSAYVEGHFGLEIGPPVVRGLQGDDVAGSVRIDGLNVRADVPLPVELYEKLEILNGPAAALYGPAPAAGTINATLKRPADEPLREIGVGYSNRGNALVRADLAGRAGEAGGLGYRLNLLQSDGEGHTQDSNLYRSLLGVAFDYRVSRDTLVEAFASHYVFNQNGYPGGFSYSNASGLPTAPDPTKAGYGQGFGGVDATVDLAELHLSRTFDSGWRVNAAVLNQVAERLFNDAITNTFTDTRGDYKTTYRQSGSRAEALSNYVYVNGRIGTGIISHDLAFGTAGYTIDNYSMPGLRTSATALTLGYGNLSNPVTYADPGWGGTGARYKTSRTGVQSVMLSDTVILSDRWSLLAAVNDGKIISCNFNSSGATTSRYDRHATWSYTGSLMFKPAAEMMLYATYASSVQPGDIAPISGTPPPNNAGESLEPYRSKELELGAKGTLAQVDWTAALFRIQRPFAYTDTDNFYKTAGQQQNDGIELTLAGMASDRVTVRTSLTLLDPRMTETLNKSIQGGLAVGVPRQQGNLLAEYRLHGFAGAFLEGDIHRVGRRAANAENTLWAEAYTTLDLGGRYETRLAGNRLTARLMIANITNQHYWASLYTGGGWSGASGNGTAFLGDPRTIKASLNLAF